MPRIYMELSDNVHMRELRVLFLMRLNIMAEQGKKKKRLVCLARTLDS